MNEAVSDSAGLIARLALEPHPEGGWYREVHRSAEIVPTARGPRAASTSIYFLLEAGQMSRWHVVDSDELWHHVGGAPLELVSYAPQTRALRRVLLGPVDDTHEPTGIVLPGVWQAARSLGAYSLLACDVAPGFDFEDFHFVASLPGHEQHFAGPLAPYANLL